MQPPISFSKEIAKIALRHFFKSNGILIFKKDKSSCVCQNIEDLILLIPNQHKDDIETDKFMEDNCLHECDEITYGFRNGKFKIICIER